MSGIKVFIFILITLILSFFFSLIGIPLNNYEVDKCIHLSENTNQEYYNYELQDDCYMPLNLPKWNLFWNVFSFFIIGLILFGLIMFFIYTIGDDF